LHHQSPQKVYILPQNYNNVRSGELKHFLKDGVDSSPFFEQTYDSDDEDAVWVVDLVRFKCQEDLLPIISKRIKRQIGNDMKERGENDVKSNIEVEVKPWKIYLIHFHDRYPFESDYFESCVGSIVDQFKSTEYVHFATRDGVKERNIIHEKDWHKSQKELFHYQGNIIEWDKQELESIVNGKVRLIRYGVRSDLVLCIDRLLKEKLKELAEQGKTKGKVMDIITIPRSLDVAHFWKVDEEDLYGSHRNVVSRLILELGDENPNRNVFANELGVRWGEGRNFVQEGYAKALLKCKIVVVAQRDHWEGHYRLMEGLVSGALVLTDPMHPLPYKIEDGKNVVVYKSISDLRSKILYYLENKKERLELARNGYDVAMKYHQNAQWMERMIFGNWASRQGAGIDVTSFVQSKEIDRISTSPTFAPTRTPVETRSPAFDPDLMSTLELHHQSPQKVYTL